MDLIDTVKNGLYSALQNRLINKANPNHTEDGVSLLHYAVVYQQPAIAQLLVNFGADFNKRDYQFDESPFELAIQHNYDEMLDIFKNKQLN